jgi:uncharacterized protein YigA (DUF484 family)
MVPKILNLKLKKLVENGCSMNVVYAVGLNWVIDLEASTSPDDIYDSVNRVESAIGNQKAIIMVFKNSERIGSLIIVDEGTERERIVDYITSEHLNSMMSSSNE